MKPARSHLLSIALIALALPIHAQPWNPPHHPIPHTPTPPTIDGLLTDPAWSLAPWTASFIDIEGPARPVVPRFHTRARMLWDATHLYIAAELEEPHVWGTLTRRDDVIFYDNDFEVFIDPDGDHHLYGELEVNALGTEWDLLLVRPYRDGGPAINGWTMVGLQSAIHVDGTLNDPTDTDRGWTVELAIPWDALRDLAGPRACPPEPGDWWRLNFSRVQWHHQVHDGQYSRVPIEGLGWKGEDNWVWAPQGVVAMHQPETWGLVTFLGPDDDPAAMPYPDPRDLLRPAYEVLWPVYVAQAARPDGPAGSLDQLDDLPAATREHVRFTGGAAGWRASLDGDGWRWVVDDEGRLWRESLD